MTASGPRLFQVFRERRALATAVTFDVSSAAPRGIHNRREPHQEFRSNSSSDAVHASIQRHTANQLRGFRFAVSVIRLNRLSRASALNHEGVNPCGAGQWFCLRDWLFVSSRVCLGSVLETSDRALNLGDALLRFENLTIDPIQFTQQFLSAFIQIVFHGSVSGSSRT